MSSIEFARDPEIQIELKYGMYLRIRTIRFDKHDKRASPKLEATRMTQSYQKLHILKTKKEQVNVAKVDNFGLFTCTFKGRPSKWGVGFYYPGVCHLLCVNSTKYERKFGRPSPPLLRPLLPSFLSFPSPELLLAS